MASIRNVEKRQLSDDPVDYGWWGGYSETAFIVKWVIFGLIVIFLVGFILGGYLHAQRRMKKGLPPLRYHAWLISRRQRERFFPPPQNSYGFYRPNGYGYHGPAYPMQPQGPPPPAYNDPDYVPAYAPPQGGSKVNPDQSYAPPPDAPPYSGVAGSSNQQGAHAASHSQPFRTQSPPR